ncbi:MAG: heterodisulfide reductase-related iron-sulfur binding cluster [Anaerolineales bacterium]|nr:heterodisulfide reductase-related iron-sulfur binding cluster [Anaerolineales bacterium]
MTTETLSPEKSETTGAKRNIDWGKIWLASKDLLVHAIAQIRIWKNIYGGIMHLLIFWGVFIQVVGTAINIQQMALFTPWVLTWPREGLYLAYEFMMDLGGVFIILGVTMAFLRRLILKPSHLGGKWDDYFVLTMFLLITIVGFFNESMRLVSANPDWRKISFAGNLLASGLETLEITPEFAFRLQPFFLLTHIGLAVILTASLPFTKLRHLVMAPLNIILRPRRAIGAIQKIEDINEVEVLGTSHINEFLPQQLLSFEACLDCGRCEEVCPATIAGMAYSPRTLIQSLRGFFANELISPNGNGHSELDEGSIQEDLWGCTTCGACLTRCPVLINPPEQIIELRRSQVLMTGQMSKQVGDTLRNFERQGNPWGMPPDDRLKWADGLDIRELVPGDEVDVLLYMGCAAAYDDRNKKVSQAFVRLLKKAEVDFGILGFDEMCCGETARRMGHEYLFQVFSEQNIEIFNSIKFNRIVTQCPHCFNTLKNEYPQMGGDYVVLHYAEFLKEILQNASSIPSIETGIQGKVAYHDSCYLGRYNNIFDAPRDLLDLVLSDRVELERHGENSFCCGAGGGGMWVETDPNTRINQARIQQVLDADVDVVATACPYCLIMFEDAIRSKGITDKVQVLDITEMLHPKP